MSTQCTTAHFTFHGLGRRKVVGGFNGGEISADGGGVLLRELELCTGLLRRLSECFTDHRAPPRIEHELATLIKLRVLGIALGYEDLNDHDELCRDRLLALLCGVTDVTGARRRWPVQHPKVSSVPASAGTIVRCAWQTLMVRYASQLNKNPQRCLKNQNHKCGKSHI